MFFFSLQKTIKLNGIVSKCTRWIFRAILMWFLSCFCLHMFVAQPNGPNSHRANKVKQKTIKEVKRKRQHWEEEEKGTEKRVQCELRQKRERERERCGSRTCTPPMYMQTIVHRGQLFDPSYTYPWKEVETKRRKQQQKQQQQQLSVVVTQFTSQYTPVVLSRVSDGVSITISSVPSNNHFSVGLRCERVARDLGTLKKCNWLR